MTATRTRYAWLALLALILLAALALLPGRAGAQEGDQPNVHPAVHTFAELFPGRDVPVIVQSGDATLPAWVEDHGGKVLRTFDDIGGFQAALPLSLVDTIDFTDRADWVSLDAPMTASRRGGGPIDASRLETVYPFAAGAVPAWQRGVTGEGVTVAVVDTGVNPNADFGARLSRQRNFSVERFLFDRSGHGTWVAGVIAGRDPHGRYVGVAPGAEIISVKVADSDGAARASDVIEALQWIVDNNSRLGVDVINISLNSAIADSYLRDPVDAAVEEAWLHGIVVVVSAGNLGPGGFAVDRAPANDPFVITVGAFDDNATAGRADDALAEWSSRGVTVDGYAKPEVAAPGVDVAATFAGRNTTIGREAPDAVDGRYVTLSGTSASAAVVSGAVALILDETPSLTPDQVKYRLMTAGAPLPGSDAPAIDAAGAAFATSTGSANAAAVPNDLIDPASGSVMDDSILWRRILWRNILWRSILWRR